MDIFDHRHQGSWFHDVAIVSASRKPKMIFSAPPSWFGDVLQPFRTVLAEEAYRFATYGLLYAAKNVRD
jgi:hypothetical protein